MCPKDGTLAFPCKISTACKFTPKRDLIAVNSRYFEMFENIYTKKTPNVTAYVTLRHELGYKVASIDFEYSKRSMDFLKASGFA